MVQEWRHGNGETLFVILDIYDDDDADNRTCDVSISVSDKKKRHNYEISRNPMVKIVQFFCVGHTV